ncbi:MAG: SMI1/KNR4 family protein [Lachnospiraceae bacterium]|nr:SMI1/KNR4 family protein [Lachnospiraceae bacterium]
MTENIFKLFKSYRVDYDDIRRAEQRMGICFPNDLKFLYSNMGYGFVINEEGAINRLIDPETCADIRLREDIYEFDPDLELYSISEENKLIFFEVNEGVYLSIGLDDERIYYLNDMIANSLEEFIVSISNNPDYWCE